MTLHCCTNVQAVDKGTHNEYEFDKETDEPHHNETDGCSDGNLVELCSFRSSVSVSVRQHFTSSLPYLFCQVLCTFSPNGHCFWRSLSAESQLYPCRFSRLVGPYTNRTRYLAVKATMGSDWTIRQTSTGLIDATAIGRRLGSDLAASCLAAGFTKLCSMYCLYPWEAALMKTVSACSAERSGAVATTCPCVREHVHASMIKCQTTLLSILR